MKFLRVLILLIGILAWVGYWSWSTYTETGLFAYIARLSVDIFGSLDKEFTWIMVGMLGIAAVTLVLAPLVKGNSTEPLIDIRQPDGPVDEDAKLRVAAKWSAIIAVLGLFASGGVYYYADTLPDGSQASININVGKVDTATLELGQKVTLDGERPSGIGVTVVTSGENSYWETHYIPVIPRGTNPQSTEVQFFEVFTSRDTTYPHPSVFADEGYIRKERLELLARDGFADQGLNIAEVTYLVETSDSSPSNDMRINAYVGAGAFGLLLLLSMAMGIHGRKRMTV